MAEKRKPSRRWTREEDALLCKAIAKYDCRDVDWQEIASHIKGRTNKDCRKRWVYTLSVVVTKGPWGQDEDQRLKAGVESHGRKWNKVSEVVGTRQADQCSRRWHECLNPNINRGRWSLLEDYILENAVQIYGRNWTEIIERFFPDRTPIATRNRYKQRFENASDSSVTKGHHPQMRAMEEEGLSQLGSSYKNDDHPSPSSLPGISTYGQLPDCYNTPGTGVRDVNAMPSGWDSEPSPAFSPLESFSTLSPTEPSYQSQNLTTPTPNRDTYQGSTNCDAHTFSRNDSMFDPTAAFAFDENAHPLNQLSALDLEKAFRQLCKSNQAQPPQQQTDYEILGNTVNIPLSNKRNSNSIGRTTSEGVATSTRHDSNSGSELATPSSMSVPLTPLSLPEFSPSNPPSLANLLSTYNSSTDTALPLERFLDQIIRQLALYRAQMTGVQALDFQTACPSDFCR